MAACATRINQKTIRGALSNGRTWIFLILTFNDDAPGGLYCDSEPIDLKMFGDTIGHESADLIAGILSHWIAHAYEELQDDDWFRYVVDRN